METYDGTRGAGFRARPMDILPPNKLYLSAGRVTSVERFLRCRGFTLLVSSEPRLDGLPGRLVDAETGVVAPRLVSLDCLPFCSLGSE